jgi:hypothetical protein
MSGLEVLAAVAVVGWIIFRQVRGEPLRGRRTVLLPAILTVIGFTDLHGAHGAHGAHLGTADIAAITIGAAGSALIGLGFGAITRLEERGGYLWAQLPVYGLWLWLALFAWRGVAFVIADGMHAHVAASASTLLFSLGVNRLAQAAVIVPRALAAGVPFAPEKNGTVFLGEIFGGDGMGDRGHFRGDGMRDRGRRDRFGDDRVRFGGDGVGGRVRRDRFGRDRVR